VHERNINLEDKTANFPVNQSTTYETSSQCFLSYTLQFDGCPERGFYIHITSIIQETGLQYMTLNFLEEFFTRLVDLSKHSTGNDNENIKNLYLVLNKLTRHFELFHWTYQNNIFLSRHHVQNLCCKSKQ
jgi:hypothetical protein